MRPVREIKPQEGFQRKALETPADIAIIGGAAGGGKTFALQLEPIRHLSVSGFTSVFFRRTYAQIKLPGGLWDQSHELYPHLGGRANEGDMDWSFQTDDAPSTISMKHLQHESDIYNYQGAQIALLIFDELTHFTAKMFWYLVSRNRSTCGIKPYIRASCNPDPDSWVALFIAWWIDPITGFPIPERAGMLRYCLRHEDSYLWADSKAEIIKQVPHLHEIAEKQGVGVEDLIKSVTFIPGTINENKILLSKDPAYIANLMLLDADERSRLLDGNWKISMNKRMIADWIAVEQVFDNYSENRSNPPRYITCDAARFGRDFMVIMVWRGWEVVFICVLKQSDTFDIQKKIEWLRQKFLLPKNRVLIDQDGVGRNTVKMGGYEGFMANEKPRRDRTPTNRRGMDIKEYDNLKSQCVFRFIQQRVNTNQLRINCNGETCEIDHVYTTKIKVGSHVVDIRDLIKADLRSYRRLEEPEVTDETKKKKIEPKELQKVLLNGRSPDFGDTLFMREWFELEGKSKGLIVR